MTIFSIKAPWGCVAQANSGLPRTTTVQFSIMLPLAWPLSLGTRLVFRKTCAFNYVGWFVRPVLLLECRWIPVYLYGSSRFFTGVSQLSQLSQLAFVQLWPWLLVLTGYFYGIIHSINVSFSTYNWYIKGHNCKFYHVCLGFPMVFRCPLDGFYMGS